MKKLYISEKLNLTPEKIDLISEFCNFCSSKLPIEGDYKVYLVSNRNNHSIRTTAAYHVGDNICKIYSKNRALVDVLRSIAHEMTHMMQDEQGLIQGSIQDAGGFHEDQANARAGELIKRFAKSKDHRKKIYENKKNTC